MIVMMVMVKRMILMIFTKWIEVIIMGVITVTV